MVSHFLRDSSSFFSLLWVPQHLLAILSITRLHIMFLPLSYLKYFLALLWIPFPCFHIFLPLKKWKVQVLVAQSCPTLYDPMNCSPPGSSLHGILQVRILAWVAIPFSRESFPVQGLKLALLHYRQILYHLSHQRVNFLVQTIVYLFCRLRNYQNKFFPPNRWMSGCMCSSFSERSSRPAIPLWGVTHSSLELPTYQEILRTMTLVPMLVSFSQRPKKS